MAQNVNPASAGEPPAAASKVKEESVAMARDSHSVSKRLQQELMNLMMASEKGISAFPSGENLFQWIGTIEGPVGTVYEGLTYKLLLEFPSSYPYKPPSVHFTSPMCFHPNIDQQGTICLDILKDKWSALYDVRTILLSIQSLLTEPNNDSPLNTVAADLWPNQTAFRRQLLEKYKEEMAGK